MQAVCKQGERYILYISLPERQRSDQDLSGVYYIIYFYKCVCSVLHWRYIIYKSMKIYDEAFSAKNKEKNF